jgi:hypothetical protein
MDNRAKHFAGWLDQLHLDSHEISALLEEHVIELLIAYLYNIAYKKGGLQKKGNVMAATLTGYLAVAVLWI